MEECNNPNRFCAECKNQKYLFKSETNTVCDSCCEERDWTEFDPQVVAYAPRWEKDNGKV